MENAGNRKPAAALQIIEHPAFDRQRGTGLAELGDANAAVFEIGPPDLGDGTAGEARQVSDFYSRRLFDEG